MKIKINLRSMPLWEKLKSTMQAIAGFALVEMSLYKDSISYKWFLALGITGLVATLIGILVTDKNKDGIVDGLE